MPFLGTFKILGERSCQVINPPGFLLQAYISTKRLSGVFEKPRQREENNEAKNRYVYIS